MTLSLSDPDALVLECRNSKARFYIVEAVACLKAGAFRSAIVATWIAVVHDLRVKMEELANSGDKNAQAKIEEFQRNVVNHDVTASQKFEREILKVAREEFELLGPMEYVDLARLQEDRDRCAHPSMLDEATDWQPAPEQARVHIVNAVNYVLKQAPVQGKAALGRLEADLRQTYYPAKVEEVVELLRHGPLARPRDVLVRNFVIVLLKECFQPLGLEGVVRNWHRRVRQTLQAVIRLHRAVAMRTLEERLDELVRSTEQLQSVVAFVCGVPETWAAISDSQQARIRRYVTIIPGPHVAESLTVAYGLEPLHDAALARIRNASGADWSALSDYFLWDPPAEIMEIAVQKMCAAKSFAGANAPGAFVVLGAGELGPAQVTCLFEAAASNDQLLGANAFRELVVVLAKKDRPQTKQRLHDAGVADEYLLAKVDDG